MTLAALPFRHLRRMTDRGGIVEHARGSQPRPQDGYCLDDVGRALVVVCRTFGQGGDQPDLIEQYVGFVVAAQRQDGGFVERRGQDLRWIGSSSCQGPWGKALWGLGAVVASSASQTCRDRALLAFTLSAHQRSSARHAMAFAGLGAARVLATFPDHAVARALLRDAAARVDLTAQQRDWPWPEPRLTSESAALADLLIAAGTLLEDEDLQARGLDLLGWLLDLETSSGHLSVPPMTGHGPDDELGGFGQLPIEVSALADACARAYEVTGEHRWAVAIELAASWFFGSNDASVLLYDPVTGGGCDSLEAFGRNEDQGAASTLALLSTVQQARWVASVQELPQRRPVVVLAAVSGVSMQAHLPRQRRRLPGSRKDAG